MGRRGWQQQRVRTRVLCALNAKMIRDCHVEALFKAVNKYEVKQLDLRGNQLGDEGAEAIAGMLRTNRSLTFLVLEENKIGDAGKRAVREARAIQGHCYV